MTAISDIANLANTHGLYLSLEAGQDWLECSKVLSLLA